MKGFKILNTYYWKFRERVGLGSYSTFSLNFGQSRPTRVRKFMINRMALIAIRELRTLSSMNIRSTLAKGKKMNLA